MRRFDPGTLLNIPVTCAGCGELIPAGQWVHPTRGVMRHQGAWVGACCWKAP